MHNLWDADVRPADVVVKQDCGLQYVEDCASDGTTKGFRLIFVAVPLQCLEPSYVNSFQTGPVMVGMVVK